MLGPFQLRLTIVISMVISTAAFALSIADGPAIATRTTFSSSASSSALRASTPETGAGLLILSAR